MDDDEEYDPWYWAPKPCHRCGTLRERVDRRRCLRGHFDGSIMFCAPEPYPGHQGCQCPGCEEEDNRDFEEFAKRMMDRIYEKEKVASYGELITKSFRRKYEAVMETNDDEQLREFQVKHVKPMIDRILEEREKEEEK
jgi:hypothetical protein